MANEDTTPVYEWAVAEVGDSVPPADIKVDPDRIALYVKTSGDDNPIYTDEAFARSKGLDGTAVPIAMAMRVAPTRRSVIMKEKGCKHPVRPTPFARWQCEFFAPLKAGELITSESQLGEKFEKHDHRICDLEKSVQAEILWRTRLIGMAAGIMAVLGLAITLLK